MSTGRGNSQSEGLKEERAWRRSDTMPCREAVERESREVVRPQEEEGAVERGESYSPGHKCILSAGEMNLY